MTVPRPKFTAVPAVFGALGALLSAAPAAVAGAPIMPLTSVQAGMQCTSLTVLSGTTPASFNGTVVSVEQAGSPTDAQIIMKFSGAAIADTGIAEGFSGSPVTCPDPVTGAPEVIGAIAYGIGDYSNFLAGVTPIEQMIGQPTLSLGATIPSIGVAVPVSKKPKLASASRVTRAARKAASRKGALSPALGQGGTALTISGLPLSLQPIFRAAAQKAGSKLLFAPQATRADVPAGFMLAPGDSVAATLVSGDVSAYSIGTVTYVDGNNVWAFGHPDDGLGARRLPMQTATISTVVPSPAIGDQVSAKLGSAVDTVGTIGFDGAAGIGGQLGPAPSTIGVTARVRNSTGVVVAQTTSQVADERAVRGGATGSLLPLAAAANTASALLRATKTPLIAGSARTCTTIYLINNQKPLYGCNDSSVATPVAADSSSSGDLSGSSGGVETAAAAAVSNTVGRLSQAEQFLGQVDHVEVDSTLRSDADTADIVKVRGPVNVKPGHTANAQVTLSLRSTGALRNVSVPFTAPKTIGNGKAAVLVTATAPGGGPTDPLAALADVLDGGSIGNSSVPTSLPALRAQFTTDGLSGLRVSVVPGVNASTARAIAGDPKFADTDPTVGAGASQSDANAAIKAAKIGLEEPTLALNGYGGYTLKLKP